MRYRLRTSAGTTNMPKIVYKTYEEAILNKTKGDRLYYDQFLKEYFIIRPKKLVWGSESFEDNFIMMPETIEECIELRETGQCGDCEYLPHRLGSWKYCSRREMLKNRLLMEID